MKKGLILLASAVMGLGLVGGAIAGWAVTDKADPLSIGISPGAISTDTTTTYITLSWGATQEISNVSNLKLNETRRAGVLDLRADTEATKAVTGCFRKKVTSANATLLSNLNVDVYKGDIPAYSSEKTSYAVGDYVIYNRTVYRCTTAISAKENFTPAKWTEDVTNKVSYEASADSEGYSYKNVAIVKNAANPYTVVVYLNSALTQTQYDDLRAASAQASVTFDWGIGTGEETSTTQTIYYKGIANPYIYAFKGDDVVNSKWPGVQMTAAKVAGYYTYQLDVTKYEYVVFNDNNGTQTADLPIASLIANGKNCCETKADGTEPAYSTHDDTLAPHYYLRGKNLTVGTTTLNWDGNPPVEYELPAFSGESTTVTVTTTGNAELKFYDATSNMWYANSDANFTLDAAGTYVLTFTPHGNPVIGAVKQ